jgi:shikimate dehydrogenase
VTTLVGVLGWPVEHSRSPSMHNAAFAELGLDWRYELLPVEPERFEPFVRELPARGFVGANVTIPHKLRALELSDRGTEVARAVGAVNTLMFRGGAIEGHNTDVEGFLRALREHVPEANRHSERARELVQALAPHADRTVLEAVRRPDPARMDLLVNATSVGMPLEHRETGSAIPETDFKELPVSADEWVDRQIVVDLVYRQDGTPLVRQARARGLRCVDGFDVLVHQGAVSFQLWTGLEAPLRAMRRGAKDGKT